MVIGIIISLLIVFSGLFKAVKDTLAHHYYNSVFDKLCPAFWNPEQSWKNKYKEPANGDFTPKFFGSTTFLVWTTDGWHLFDMMQSLCWQMAIVVLIMSREGFTFQCFVPALAGVTMCFYLTFEILYKRLSK